MNPPHPNRNKARRLNPTPEQIKELRLQCGLTQAEFGELVNCAKRTVINWESGDGNMHPVFFDYIQHIYNIKSIPQREPKK